MITIPEPTAEEQAAEDFSPLPMIAPAANGVALMAYRMALPDGNGRLVATFEITEPMFPRQALIRYTNGLPPTIKPLSGHMSNLGCEPGDTLIIFLRYGSR